MRPLATVLAVSLLTGFAARADIVDLSDGGSRRARRAPTFALRAEGGSDFAPYGHFGACFSYFTENPIGGVELEAGAGTGLPGVQIGGAVRQLVGEAGSYFALEISVAGNTVKKLGRDVSAGHLNESNLWSSLGVGFEVRQWFVLSVVGGLAFTSSFDLVPHPMVHGGIGFAF